MLHRVVFGFLLTALAAAAALAQAPAAAIPDRELVVGVFEAPPYAMKSPAGEWRGLTVDLWREIAADLGVRFRLEEKTQDEIVSGLSGGGLDVAVAPVPATIETERVVDFSHSYLRTGLAIAVRQRSRPERLLHLFRSLITSDAAHIIAGIAILSLVFGAALWLLERRRNPQFPAHPATGIGSGFWWAAVTASSVGYGDKVPVTLRGRLVAILWMVVSVILYVVLTAGLTATLAVAQIQQGEGIASLRHSVVGTLDGSPAGDFLRKNRVPHRLYPSFERAIDDLARRKLDAVMFGEDILHYYAMRNVGAKLEVLPQIFMSADLAFPLPDGSPLRTPLNAALRRALAGPRWEDSVDRYLGTGGSAD